MGYNRGRRLYLDESAITVLGSKLPKKWLDLIDSVAEEVVLVYIKDDADGALERALEYVAEELKTHSPQMRACYRVYEKATEEEQAALFADFCRYVGEGEFGYCNEQVGDALREYAEEFLNERWNKLEPAPM